MEDDGLKTDLVSTIISCITDPVIVLGSLVIVLFLTNVYTIFYDVSSHLTPPHVAGSELHSSLYLEVASELARMSRKLEIMEHDMSLLTDRVVELTRG